MTPLFEIVADIRLRAMTSFISLSLFFLACARPIADAEVRTPADRAPGSPFVDMTGFNPLVPVVHTIDGVAWIAFDAGDLAVDRYVPLTQVRAGEGPCSTRASGQVWMFPSEPPMRLHLGRDGAVIEALDGACWRSALAPAPTLTTGKKLSARGSTRSELTLALASLDPRLDEITLHAEEIALTMKGGSTLTGSFDDAMMTDWAPDSPTDYDQEFEHARTFTVTSLLGPDGKVVALRVSAHEVGDGDASWQGGSHHHIRDTEWHIALDPFASIDFVSKSSASYSGDGASGTDYAAIRRTQLSLPLASIAGSWRDTSGAKTFSDEAAWTLLLPDGTELAIGLPFHDELRADDERDEAPTTREQLTRDLVVVADGKAVRIERKGLAPAVVPLLAAPHTDRDSVELSIGKSDDGRAYIVRVAAYRKVDPALGPQVGDHGEEVTIEDQRYELLYVSTRTLQVVHYTSDGPEAL